MVLEELRKIKLLAVATPSGTSAVSALSKSAGRKLVLTCIRVVNTSAGALTYSLYLDSDGTTYDDSTALAVSQAIAANTSVQIEFQNGLPFEEGAAGNFAVQSSSASDITFWLIGYEV